ncbi:MAG TPA: hypothetical protein VF462_15165, partial [Micromonosporaceae bacterium]
MSTQQTSQDNPLAGFGPNEWIVEEMYQRYLADPASVDPAWHDFFADYRPSGDASSTPAPVNGTPARVAEAAPMDAADAEATTQAATPQPSPAKAPAKA